MLQFLHRASQSIVMRGLFAVLLFAFVIFGIGDVLRSRGGADEVATVGRERITPQQLSAAFQQQLDRVGRQMGGKVDLATAKRAGFLERTLDAMISDMLIGLAAHDEGFLIGDKLVVEEIQQIPNFQDPVTKQFNPALFRQLLAQQGLSEGDAIRSEKLDYAKRLMTGAELGTVPPPGSLRDVYNRFQGETRRGQAIYIDTAGIKVPAPTAAQLKEYYDKHSSDFTAPEYRDFSFLYVEPSDLARSVQLTADELKQAFDARQNEFKVPERRDLSQVILRDQEKANQIVALVRGGKSFAAAVKATGSSEPPFDLGLMAQQDLPDALQQPVFSAPADSVVLPVRTELGWHVIAVHRVEPPRLLGFAEAKPALQAELEGEKARDLLTETAKHIDDALAGGASLAEAGKPYGLAPIVAKEVDATGKHADGSVAKELTGKEALLKAAFATDKGIAPQVVQDDRSAYAFSVDQIAAPALKPLDTVKISAAQAYTANARAEAANVLATRLLKTAKVGESFTSLARQANAIVTPVGPFAHAAGERGDSAPIVAALFNSTIVGQVQLAAAKSGPALVQLSEIIAPQPLPKGEQATVDRALETQMQNDFRTQYEQSLRGKYRVTVNNAVLRQMNDAN